MSDSPYIPALFAVALIVGAGSVCVAQPVKVDPGSSDASPNAVSLRHLDVDLRRPTGFDGVYQLSKVDAFGRGQSMFMRIDGGIIAVFPRSVYVPTEHGLVPEIPAGTIFNIGDLPQALPLGSHVSPNYLDPRVSDRRPTGGDQPPVVREIPVARSMILNETYRRRRIEALLALDAS